MLPRLRQVERQVDGGPATYPCALVVTGVAAVDLAGVIERAGDVVVQLGHKGPTASAIGKCSSTASSPSMRQLLRRRPWWSTPPAGPRSTWWMPSTRLAVAALAGTSEPPSRPRWRAAGAELQGPRWPSAQRRSTRGVAGSPVRSRASATAVPSVMGQLRCGTRQVRMQFGAARLGSVGAAVRDCPRRRTGWPLPSNTTVRDAAAGRHAQRRLCRSRRRIQIRHRALVRQAGWRSLGQCHDQACRAGTATDRSRSACRPVAATTGWGCRRG
jgi:hypothetical protein